MSAVHDDRGEAMVLCVNNPQKGFYIGMNIGKYVNGMLFLKLNSKKLPVIWSIQNRLWFYQEVLIDIQENEELKRNGAKGDW